MNLIERQICNIYDLLKIARNPKVREISMLMLVSMMDKRKALAAGTVKAG